MKEKVFSDIIRFIDDNYATKIPKLSIHESGQVHIKADAILAGPLFIKPLSEWRGEPIASIAPDSIKSLPKYLKQPIVNGSTIDIVIPISETLQYIRLAIYLSGDKPEFETSNIYSFIMLVRKTGQSPLFLGLKFIGQDELLGKDYKGITCMAGWDPKTIHGGKMDYLYIRGL